MKKKIKMVKESPEKMLADTQQVLNEVCKQRDGLNKVNQELLDELWLTKQLLHTYLGEELGA